MIIKYNHIVKCTHTQYKNFSPVMGLHYFRAIAHDACIESIIYIVYTGSGNLSVKLLGKLSPKNFNVLGKLSPE